jgi:hypothetical protein
LANIQKAYNYQAIYEANGLRYPEYLTNAEIPHWWFEGAQTNGGNIYQLYFSELANDYEVVIDSMQDGHLLPDRYLASVGIEKLSTVLGVDVEILNQIAAERDSQRLIELLSNYSDNLRLTSESLIVIGGPQNVFVAHAGAPPFLTGYDMPGNFMEWIDSHGQ